MRLLFFLGSCLSSILAPALGAAELQVFAAASLTDALTEIAPAYEKATGDTLKFNFAGSNVLARQIQEGAPADLFLSADEIKMDQLQKAGLLVPETRTVLLSNSLVMVVPHDGEMTIREAKDLARPELKLLALADPNGVPAGIYAKNYLVKAGVWDSLEGRIVSTENVRAALAAVEAGNANAGIVYKTDAASSKGVKIAYEVPPSGGPKIAYPYPIAVTKASEDPEAARKFLEYLKSEEVIRIFHKFGFISPQN